MNLSITPTIEDHVASWPVTEDWAYGETEEEAIENLTSVMVETLSQLENEDLGPLMKQKVALLKLYVHTTYTG